MDWFVHFVIENPKKVIITALLVTAMLASGVAKINIEEDIKAMLPHDMPSRQTLNELEEVFGGSDVALIGIGNEEETIFNVGTLKKIRAITDSLDVIPDVNRVTSLATVKYMEGHDWGLEVTPYLEEEPETAEDAARIRDMFYKDSTYVGILVSEDGMYTAVVAQMREDAELLDVYEELQSLITEYEGPEKFYVAGTPIVTTIVAQSIKHDLRRLIPFVILLIVILLYASFRSLIGVLLPLAAVVMSLLSMLGVMGHLGITFTTINNIMPVILLGIGIDYGIHVMAMYYQNVIMHGDKKKSIFESITDIRTPLFMACITTMIGFLSLFTSPLDVHHEFGSLLAFGVFMAMVFNLTFVPAFLSFLPIPKGVKVKRNSGLVDRVLTRIGDAVISFRHGFAVAAFVIIVISLYGIPRVNIEMNPVTFFPEDSEIVQADRMINSHLGGSVNMNVLFEGDIQSREVMHAMDSLEQFIDGLPETGSTISLATVVKKINKSLNDNDPAYEVIPDSDAAIAQAMLIYSMSGDPDDFENIVDNAYEYGQVIAMLRSFNTEKISEITESIQHYIDTNIDAGVSVRTTGFSVFFKDLAHLIVTSQIRSIIFAVIMVFLIAVMTYRSFLLGLAAIIPLSMCVLLNFAIMGYFGIDLSIPMAMLASIIIGIGVDFSFHLISRFKAELTHSDPIEAVKLSMRRIGEPILYSAFTTACGGLVLLISGFVPVRYLGFLLALIMIVCAFLALTILASALSYVKLPSNNKG
ncbi:RND family transporter [candidate division KSB1 bacterium]